MNKDFEGYVGRSATVEFRGGPKDGDTIPDGRLARDGVTIALGLTLDNAITGVPELAQNKMTSRIRTARYEYWKGNLYWVGE